MKINRNEGNTVPLPRQPRTVHRSPAPPPRPATPPAEPAWPADEPPLVPPGDPIPVQEPAPAPEPVRISEAPRAPAKPQRKPRPAPKPRPRPQPKPEEDDLDEDEEEDDRDTGRPMWHMLLSFLIMLAFVAVIAVGTWQGFKMYGEVDGATELGMETSVTVEQGASLATISETLKKADIIEYEWLFRLYAKYSGRGDSLQYGTFTVQRGMSYNDLLKALSVKQERKSIRITFPEGTTAVGIAQLMEKNGLCTIEEFLACANGEDGSDFSQYDFWIAIPNDPRRLMKCEGYLFPNTYDFYVDDTVYNYVNTFYRQFDRQTADLADKLAEKDMTLDELVILASLIQEEAGIAAEDPKISACFYNRLRSTDEAWAQHHLESNTCSHFMNDNENNYLWNSPMASYMGWKAAGAIPQEVLAAYDTYTVSGLPAGAVSNPGMISLNAALYPNSEYLEEGYFFFVTGRPGTDVAGQYFYAKTAEQHAKNVEKAGW